MATLKINYPGQLLPYVTLLILYLTSFQFTLVAQEGAPKLIPPTPSVAAMAKYGDIPISLYTGQVQYSIPIYTIKTSDFNLPISLSNSSNGLRPDEYPSWVGHGWTLNVGGVITRQVRGLEDEREYGYNGKFMFGKEVRRYLNNEMTVNEVEVFKRQIATHQKDAEPDMFVFNFGSHSGKFFFDDTQYSVTSKRPVCIPANDLKIWANFDYNFIYNIQPGSIRGFTIIDAEGVTYTFQPLEIPGDAFEKGDPDRDGFINSWHLTQIITPNSEVIDFTYKTRILDMPSYRAESRNIGLLVGDFDKTPPLNTNVTNSYSSIYEAILTSISYPGGSIEFIEGEERNDWNVPQRMADVRPRTLERIVMKDYKGEIIKNYLFEYDNNDSRLFLNKFHEQTATNNDKYPPYEFFYHTISSVPGFYPTNLSQDYWGFWNQNNSQTLLPSYIGTAVNSETGNVQVVSFSGANKSPNLHAAKAGMLTKVRYPTGGYSAFVYEHNDYYANFSDIPYYAFRDVDTEVARVRANTLEGDTTHFHVDVAQEVLLHYILQTNCEGAEVEVGLYTENWEQQYFKLVKAGVEDPIKHIEETVPVPLLAGNYILRVTADDEHCSANMAAADIQAIIIPEDGPTEGTLQGGGVRIAKIDDCLENGECISTYYKYNDIRNPAHSSGRLVEEPNFYHDKISILKYNSGGTVEAPYKVISSRSNFPLVTSQGGYVGYKYVTELKEENGSLGKTVYEFTSPEDFPDQGYESFPFPPKVSMDWKRGKLITKTIENSAGDILNKDKNFYNLLSGYLLPYDRTVGVKAGEYKTSYVDGLILDESVSHNYVDYQIVSGYPTLYERHMVKFDHTNNPAKELVTIESLEYNGDAHLQVTSKVMKNSDKKEIRHVYRYPEDVDEVSGLLPDEIEAINRLRTEKQNRTAVIEIETQADGQEVKKERTIYKDFGGLILPSAKRFSINKEPYHTSIEFLDYTDQGRVESYKQGGEATDKSLLYSYLWGYGNTLPICKIENANQEDVFYTSFENGGTGTVEDAKTGRYGYMGEYQVSSNIAKVLSYWIKEGPTGIWEYKEESINGSKIIGTANSIVDEVRIYPEEAMLTTYTYSTANGITSVTDPNNVTTYYIYDEEGRLKETRDSDYQLLNSYEYNYKSFE